MKTICRRLPVHGGLFLFFAGASGLGGSAPASESLTRVSGIDLISKKPVSFPSSAAKATVYVFMSARCPCSNGHEESLKQLHAEFSKSGFEFVGIHSNQNETSEETRKHFLNSKLPFPILEDPEAKLADAFRALKTPHVYVRRGEESLFEGGVDDTSSGVGAKKPYLRNALQEIRDGKPVSESRVRVLGCAIQRARG